MFTVTIVTKLPGWLSLDELDNLVETVRESARPVLTGRVLTITWRAESEWELRGLFDQTLAEVASLFGVMLYEHDPNDLLLGRS